MKFLRFLISIGLTSYLYSQTLQDALDNYDLNFITGGNANWFYQTNYYYYDNDAAQSGTITHNQLTFLKTTIQSPCSLKFYWRVSSEANYDFLSFVRKYAASQLYDRISGTTGGWIQKKIVILSPGTDTMVWTYSKDGSGSSGQDAGWVDYVRYFPINNNLVTLQEALDNTNLTFYSDGSAPWIGETCFSYDGQDAAISGRIPHNGFSRLYTNVVGPCSLKFYWRVSSEANYDRLYFLKDDTLKDFISGTTGGWVLKRFIINASGNHSIKWVYSKDGANSNGSDCAWVDKFEYFPIGTEISEKIDTEKSYFAIYNNLGGDLKIRFYVSEEDTKDKIELSLYNITGRKMIDLLSRKEIKPGEYILNFNLSKDKNLLKRGFYFLKFTTSTKKYTKKILIME
ncbi:MAG: T9SS type A sorting domain-containing protein [candidate division WOR-3 bacterium]